MGNDILDAVMSAGTSLVTNPDLAGHKGNIVIDHYEILLLVRLIIIQHFPHTLTAQIHIGLRFYEHHPVALDHAFSDEGFVLLFSDIDPVLLRQKIQGIKAGIVPGKRIILARIAETDNQVRHRADGLFAADLLEKIKNIMSTLRENPPAAFGEYEVLVTRDYDKDIIKSVKTGEEKPTGIPKSNVLYYELNDDAWVCVRPSGTEPKIKFYYGIKGDSAEDAAAKSQAMKEALDQLSDRLVNA